MTELIMSPCAGLANRIRALVSALCAAKANSLCLRMLWCHERAICNTAFSMLFDIESLPSGLTIEEIGSFPPSLEVKTEKEWMEYRKSGSNVPIKSNGIFFKEGWDPMLRSLRAAPSIVERAEHILGSRRPIGVHIRRTDNKKSIEYSPSRLFWETMETYPNDVFFLASDSEEDRQEAYRRFPGRIITAGTLVPRYAPLGTYYAMLDLYCLSRCSQILGSYYSSFTEIAAAWGGIPLRVVRLPL